MSRIRDLLIGAAFVFIATLALMPFNATAQYRVEKTATIEHIGDVGSMKVYKISDMKENEHRYVIIGTDVLGSVSSAIALPR